jgi:CHAP domain-containing protein
MKMKILVAAAALVLGGLAIASPAQASAGNAATLAADNIGKTAGACAVHPSVNSLGGSQFETSCSGNGGNGEYWCADFVKWVWRNSGLSVSGLTAAAKSFYAYGQSHGTFHETAQPGDAITFRKSPGAEIHHVGIVTAVKSDGSVVVANGDFNGESGSQSHFARTATVVSITISSAQAKTGSYASGENMYIAGIVGPSGSGGSAPPSDGNPYSATGVCGSGYGVVDSHHITGATIFLAYDDASGKNCVVTLADADLGAVTMNATLAVQDGATAGDPGSYHWYAGPVSAVAPNSCVKWGGTYKTASWTSDWGHCGNGNGSPPPAEQNPYSPEEICGSGYDVVDHHALSGADIYLLYSDATGKNCVTTVADGVGAAATMNATLAVQGGASTSDSGTYAYYAGPVYEYAPSSCVKWGGSYQTSSWTSGYGHCGGGSTGGAANPYTAAQVCGSGYAVIDSHNLGKATVYLLYSSSAGRNCVATLVHQGSGSVGLNATLSVQGGSSGSNPGLFQWYAGPVRLAAANACVKWGGSYESTTWTSAWSHCA